MEAVEPLIQNGVQWIRLVVETIGALIIATGVLVAAVTFLRAAIARQSPNFTAIRISFARFLALALEFQLGADILSTAIAPTWDAIGKLGAIAIIRTALNFFLMQEMKEERTQLERNVMSREQAADFSND
ncbi:MAG: DUF1622 domain-containing protein [Caldilineaceae bacterium]